MIEKLLFVMFVTWLAYALGVAVFVYFAALSVRQAFVQVVVYVCGSAAAVTVLGLMFL